MGRDYSPYGIHLATGSADNTAKVWNVTTGEALLTLTGHTDAVYSVAFSADGTRLTTAGGTVRVYALRIEDLVALARSRLTRTFTTKECQQYLHLGQ